MFELLMAVLLLGALGFAITSGLQLRVGKIPQGIINGIIALILTIIVLASANR